MRLPGLSVVLVEVDVGGEPVLQRVEGAHEGEREDHDAPDEGEGEGQTQLPAILPMKARLKSQKTRIRYYYIHRSIITQLLMLRNLQDSQGQERELLGTGPPVFARGAGSGAEVEGCAALLEGLIGCQPALAEKLSLMRERVGEREYNKGIGYFNAKNLMFIQYLIQLEFYQLFRINAVDLTKDTGLELYRRLVYLKTLLMKLSPVEKKLQYQKNKLLKLSDLVAVKGDNLKRARPEEEGEGEEEAQQAQEQQEESEGGQIEQEQDSEQDALAYQPRPQSLLAVKQKKQASLPKDGKYVAPKLSSALSKQDKLRRRQQQQEQRRKKHLIRKYRDDLLDDDDARQEGVENVVAEKIKRKFREKTSIEQDNFVRFPESKKDKFWKKQLIQRHNKTDELRDSLKDIEMVGKIYRSEAQEELKSDGLFRAKQQLKSHKAGSKKQKRE